jgi:hypothetical protein
MIVESMTDQEFAKEVITDFFYEMKAYINRALAYKGKTKRRHMSTYISKRGNKWLLIYTPERGGQSSMHVKRPQPKEWFTWYSLMLLPNNSITLFGFNKHVAQRISERYYSDLTPTDALQQMLMRTPAIVQTEVGDRFYTRVNGGICIGSAFGKRILVSVDRFRVQVDLRETRTFVSDDMLYDEQKSVTEKSIADAIAKLGKDYLSDTDREI